MFYEIWSRLPGLGSGLSSRETEIFYENSFTTSGLDCLGWALDWAQGRLNFFYENIFTRSGLAYLGWGLWLAPGRLKFFTRKIFYEIWTGLPGLGSELDSGQA